ncbi:MAG: hypothetical protein VW239_00365 [Candidatus Nanopelagicales bacterium]
MTPPAELRSAPFPDRAELHGPGFALAGSGTREVGLQSPASRRAVSTGSSRGFRAQRRTPAEIQHFTDADDALRWCGLGLTWAHHQHRPGRTMLLGRDERGNVSACITGPLLAVLPECCPVEVVG